MSNYETDSLYKEPQQAQAEKNEDGSPKISPALSMAAFGSNGLETADFDLAGETMKSVLSSLDVLLGQREVSLPVPAIGSKGSEFVSAFVQTYVIAASNGFVMAELGRVEPHIKPKLDAKARAELQTARATIKAMLENHEHFSIPNPKAYEYPPASKDVVPAPASDAPTTASPQSVPPLTGSPRRPHRRRPMEAQATRMSLRTTRRKSRPFKNADNRIDRGRK